jgi:NAD+ diphosphatase
MMLPAEFVSSWAAPAGVGQAGLWYVFHGNRLLVSASPDGTARLPACASLPLPSAGIAQDQVRFVGTLGGVPIWTAPADGVAVLPGHGFESLRALFNRLPDDLLAIGGRALQLLEFDRRHRHCGSCGERTAIHEAGRSRKCTACGETYYPRVSPAMMVLIERDGPRRQLLLARSPRFPPGMYSALAGFVEPSESIEQCIHRETLEEVGVRVCNLRYYASEGWPFPDSLMIAYVADFAGGEIAPQQGEIEDARWFAVDDLPRLPPRLSIARRLIEHVVADASRHTAPKFRPGYSP